MLVTLQRSIRVSIKMLRTVLSWDPYNLWIEHVIGSSVVYICSTNRCKSTEICRGKVERKAYVKRHHAADGLRDTKCHQCPKFWHRPRPSSFPSCLYCTTSCWATYVYELFHYPMAKWKKPWQQNNRPPSRRFVNVVQTIEAINATAGHTEDGWRTLCMRVLRFLSCYF